MKATLLLLLAVFAFQLPAQATALGLLRVHMPLYLHGSDMDSTIQIMEIPVMNFSNTNEARYSWICHAFVPPRSESVKTQNINIAAEYGIVTGMEEKQVNGVSQWTVTVDASKARVPEGYPFTLEQVIDAVVTCARLTTPQVSASQRVVTVEVRKPTKA